MKRILLIFFAFFWSTTGFSLSDDTLVYRSNRKLKWEDFKGRPKASDGAKGAEITVTINLKVDKVSFWTGKAKYDVYAVALKERSWVKTAYKDEYTLAHEQLHFDIAHLYAETLEAEINNLAKQDVKKDRVEELHQKYLKEMGIYQRLYDQETSGGNNLVKQKEWANKIKEDLKFL